MMMSNGELTETIILFKSHNNDSYENKTRKQKHVCKKR